MKTLLWIGFVVNLIKIVMWYGGDKVGWGFPIEMTWIIIFIIFFALMQSDKA